MVGSAFWGGSGLYFSCPCGPRGAASEDVLFGADATADGGALWSEKRWAVWDKVQEANNLIEAYCATQQNLYFIHFQESFFGSDGQPIKKLYREDKLHYNEEGYKVWGNAIRRQVKENANKIDILK